MLMSLPFYRLRCDDTPHKAEHTCALNRIHIPDSLVMTTVNEGQGEGLAVGALDIVLLVVAVFGGAVLFLRCRRRGKKELVKRVSVPMS